MSGATPGEKLAGLFLVIFGVSCALFGGGCTLLLLSEGLGSSGGRISVGGILVLLPLFVLAGGVTAVWAGSKLMREPRR